MSEPRLWPTIAADDRDKAAGFMNNGAENLAKVRAKVPAEYRADLLAVEVDLQKGLRCLEKHGARTRIPDPLPSHS